ncbi:MAG: hypothetical protein QXU89_05080 [Desulfurococcaceae archaeon]
MSSFETIINKKWKIAYQITLIIALITFVYVLQFVAHILVKYPLHPFTVVEPSFESVAILGPVFIIGWGIMYFVFTRIRNMFHTMKVEKADILLKDYKQSLKTYLIILLIWTIFETTRWLFKIHMILLISMLFITYFITEVKIFLTSYGELKERLFPEENEVKGEDNE